MCASPAGPSTAGPGATAGSYPELVERVVSGEFGPLPGDLRISSAFTTHQAVRHDGRNTGYRNEVLSLRLAAVVGSCAVEPGSLPGRVVAECAGSDAGSLLGHPLLSVRVAALDAYLMHTHRHGPVSGAVEWALPSGSSLIRSQARAQAVVSLLRLPPGRRVLVVGVVNSLLEELRTRGLHYVPCDFKGGVTEWGEPVTTDAIGALDHCDAVLASGMTLGNGTFEELRVRAQRQGKPLVMFAQTGSAVLPRLIGAGVTAVCAEPYPFFWLDGGAGSVHLYGEHAGATR
ncbi:Rossmann-like domain-containing protein [Streptomyces sp. NPDC002690]